MVIMHLGRREAAKESPGKGGQALDCRIQGFILGQWGAIEATGAVHRSATKRECFREPTL